MLSDITSNRQIERVWQGLQPPLFEQYITLVNRGGILCSCSKRMENLLSNLGSVQPCEKIAMHWPSLTAV